MADNVFKTRGQTKAASPDAGNGVTREVPVFGIVKNNIDSIKSGRIQVYIENFGSSNPDDSNSWITVSYMTPFYGVTQPTAPNTGYGDYVGNPTSYGMWYSAPDIGSKVICIFINGDPNYGYWIGCVPEPEALTMVPAIGSSDNVTMNKGEADSYGGATRLPVSNMNTNDSSKADSASFLTTAKPVHSYSASILAQQGLIRDPVRGTIGTSAQRESPSRVGWGVNTPGRPIYQGGFTDDNIVSNLTANKDQLQMINRRAGHSIVMDDGDINGKDQLIRLRTALGHQILMSDDGQTLFIIHSNGQSYIELGKEGTIDMYSTNSVNIRTQGDLNLHADNNININAGKDLNIAAKNMNVNTETDTNFRVGGNFSNYIQGSYTVKVDGSLSLYSDGEASLASSGTTYVTGPSAVNLNTGSASLVPAVVAPIPIMAQTDTLFDKAKGWAAAPGKLLTIVSRAPAHSPWANANQGVDVKVDNDADAALPAAPSSAVASVNSATSGTPPAPTSPSLISTVPGASAASAALDASTTAGMVGAAASTAAATAANVVKAGTGTITDAAGKLTAAVGPLAQTPAQLVTANVLKPGADKVVNGLVAQGKTVAEAMTPNLFTGKPGAQTLDALVNNTKAAVETQIANIQSAQAGLTKAGVITGKEAPTQIAGLVNAAASSGVKAVTDFTKNVTGSIGSAISGVTDKLTGGAGSIAGQISAGNFAAGITSSITGGLGSIATSLTGMANNAIKGVSGLLDSAKGVAGSAFAAITKSFKSFTPGVPQNLKAIAEKNAAEAASADAASAGGGILDSAKTALSSATGALSGATSGLSGLAGSATGLLNSVKSAASGAISSVTGAISSLTAGAGSGIGNLPGGLGAISSNISKAADITSKIPGLAGASALAKNASTAINNGISLANSASSAIGSISKSISGATSGLDKLASGASGSLGSLTGATGSLNSLASSASGALSKLGNTSLSSLVSSGLPASLGAQLSSAINSIGAGGPFPIKLPIVASDTSNRTSLASQISSVLGNSKIPVPNFSKNPELLTAETERLNKLVDQQLALSKDHEKQGLEVDKARDAFVAARDSLPAGDPGISSALDTYNAELAKLSSISAKMKTIAEQALG